MRWRTRALVNAAGFLVPLFLFFAPIYHHGSGICFSSGNGCSEYYTSATMELTDHHYGATYWPPGLNRDGTPNNGFYDVVAWNYGDWFIAL